MPNNKPIHIPAALLSVLQSGTVHNAPPSVQNLVPGQDVDGYRLRLQDDDGGVDEGNKGKRGDGGERMV